ncbi:MAG: thioredoxin-disulfide reductase [Candidatus Cloacimonetes bacterium]|nr:thioredoxin-disulfide reductase [Candidatus Cloacimonadota bacterium]
MENVVIIGHGPAGLTSAIYTARAGLAPLVLSSSAELGQLDQTTDVENFPGFPEGILGPDIIVNMHKQAERFGAKFQTAHVEKITGEGPFVLHTASSQIETRTIILATGAKPRRLGIESESRLWGHGVTACAVCDGFFYRNREVIVIGGGDSACEEATYLTKFASRVYLVHRRDQLRASKIMAERAMNHPKVEMVWNSEVAEILGNSEDGVVGVVLRDTTNGSTREMKIDGVFLSIGHIPNTEPFKDLVDRDSEGYIILEEGSTKTSRPGVFAAGDLHDKHYRQAITAAGFGCMAALDAERFLASQAG